MTYLNSFLIGGFICLIAQLILDVLKWLPVKVACTFVVVGSLLRINDLYGKLIDFCGAGALLPISSFGYTMTDASIKYGIQEGFLGLFKGPLTSTSIGITFAVILSIIMALIFKPKG